MDTVTATAHANIALIKYWGKASREGNVPAVGSISLGLDALHTRTTVTVAAADEVSLGWGDDPAAEQRIVRFLDQVRACFSLDTHFAVQTENNFPTGAGLASSASGFAALTLAISKLCGLELSGKDAANLARLGSGSAARSVLGGYVELALEPVEASGEKKSDRIDVSQVAPASHWPLDVIVAITDEAAKPVSSTEAMLNADTSPYYNGWLASHPHDMATARRAITDRDFATLAQVAESSCLKMHGVIMSQAPSVVYWNPATLAVMHQVRALRDVGMQVFFTIDAGPQVKVVCEPDCTEAVRAAIANAPGVVRTIVTRVGGEPRVQEGS